MAYYTSRYSGEEIDNAIDLIYGTVNRSTARTNTGESENAFIALQKQIETLNNEIALLKDGGEDS